MMAAKFPLSHASGGCRRVLCSTGLLLTLTLCAVAQSTKPVTAKPAVPTVEPGLETVVKWRWTPEASDPAAWGLSLEAPPQPATPGTGSPTSPDGKPAPVQPQGPPEQTLDYTIQKGDSLYVIAKRYSVTIDQLKLFNQMKTDRIVIGQTLRIPSLADIKIMQPPPPPPEPKKVVAIKKAVPVSEKKPEDTAPEKTLQLKRPLPSAASSVARVVLMQAYLDRQGFSAGPIDGTDGPLYEAAIRSYETTHPGVLISDMGQVPAVLKELGGAYTEYQLTRDDLRWIAPQPTTPPASGRKKSAAAPEQPITLENLTSVPFLPYRSAWEFVAERYHCSESFLRRINQGLKAPVTAGALFIVPNVLPFELETALKEPLQPAADPAAPVTATIIGNSRLEVRRSGKLIANLPVSVARPGLRGRGTWKILEAIARPRLTSTGDPAAPMTTPMVLPPGPNNPVGPIWIYLAKAKEKTPLPYGLHGTSIPGYMTRQESVGGFRMTNWDIARVVRLLPVDTPLTWQ